MPRPIDIALALVVAFGAGAAAAEPPELTEQPWRVADLVVDADLLGLFVMQVDFDAAGNVWLATTDGLRVGDGYRWRRYGTADGLPSDFVRCVLVRGDEIWTGTDHGVAVMRNGRFEPVEPGPVGPNVRRLVSTSDGALWVCSDTWLQPGVRAGLSRWRDGRWSSFTTEDGLPSNYVQDLFEDSSGRCYAFTLDGPAEYHEGRWRPVPGWPAAGAVIWSAAESAAGDVVFAAEHELFVRRGETWRRLASPDPRIYFAKSVCRVDGEIMGVFRRGRLEHRFARWNGESFEPIGASWRRVGTVEHAREAPDGDVWCVGQDVLALWRRHDARWMAFASPDGDLGLDRAGRAWLVGEEGAWRTGPDDAWTYDPDVRGVVSVADPAATWSWQGDRITRHADAEVVDYEPEATGIRRPSMHLVDARGRSWFRGRDEGGRLAVTAFDDGTWVPHPDAATLLEEPCGWAADHDGSVWIAADDRRSSIVRVVRLDTPEGSSSVSLGVMASADAPGVTFDSLGRCLVYGAFGLYRQEAAGWTRVNDLPAGAVSHVVEHGGTLWVSSHGMTGGRGGLSRLRDGRWTKCVHEDVALVGAGRNGAPIFARGPRLFLTGDDGEISRLVVPVLGEVQHAVLDAGGDLWLQMSDVLLRYRGDGIPPETEIVSASREIERGEPLDVRAIGTERFRPRGESGIGFSWRFGEDAWTGFGPLPDRGIAAPDAVGRHRLEIRARDEDGDTDPTPAVAIFEVLPVPIQHRAWFLPAVIVVGAFVVMLAALVLLSRIRIRRYADRLERSVERESITAHLTDARLRAAVDNIPALVFEADARGQANYVNEPWTAMTGRPAESALGDGWSNAVHPEDRSRVAATWREAVAAGAEWHAEFRFEHRDGSDCWVIARAVPVRDTHGRVDSYLGTCTDITKHKRLEDQQRRLMNELNHRVRNNLSALLSLLTITRESAGSVDDFVAKLAGRIESMAMTHDTLARKEWRDVPIRKMLREALSPAGALERVSLRGPDIDLPAPMAGPFALCLHELTTNAQKHGAFTVSGGLIEVKWDRTDGGLVLDWCERNGVGPGSGADPGAGPIVPAMGLQLVQGLVKHDLKGSVAFASDGCRFRCTMEIDLG